MAKKNIRICGTVKEVRAFNGKVIVFVQVTLPKKVLGKFVRFDVDVFTESRACPENWAKLAIGDEVAITRFYDENCTHDMHYKLKVTKSEVINAADL